ncbi:P-loop containing nucleoside triphosphate hydrolase protein [Thozetella sp. PMI_491]|nr:P-loop containing nucleoside triphosphate hydrolase protein [Thozetella sp. PMI_491]
MAHSTLPVHLAETAPRISWSSQPKGVRTDTDFSILEALRKEYQGHHVTRTVSSKCDLMGFARAGYANAMPRVDEGTEATRVYRLPPSRLDTSPGSLEEVKSFGCWDYNWEGYDFLVFQISYQNQFHEAIHLLYVLTPLAGAAGQIQGSNDNKTDALLLASGQWTRELHQEIWVYDNAQWIKSKSLWKSVQDASWDDVILNPKTKAKLLHDVEGFFDNRNMYQKLRIPWKRGVIFHGVPGNGKTISIKALINTLAQRKLQPIQSLYVKSLDACSGPKWSIRQIFRKARRMAPCMLIFEDLDSLVGDQTRSYFLNEVDGLESNDGILMIGSTNHIDRLDPAVAKRPSRFDRKYHFKLPNEEERLAYCRYWCAKFAGSDDEVVSFPEGICPIIAKLTNGFSFAYLKELFVTSLLVYTRGDFDDDELEEVSIAQGKSSKDDETALAADTSKGATNELKLVYYLRK